jgi:hypothetical protein
VNDQDQDLERDLETARAFARALLVLLLGSATLFVVVGAVVSMLLH